MLTRRAVTGLLAAGGGALTLAVIGKRLDHPTPGKVPSHGRVGTIDEETLATLMISARTLTGLREPGGPYGDYYAYQALNRPGYLDAYRDFARAVRRFTNADTAAALEKLSADRRWSVLEAVSRSSNGEFDVPVHHETLAVFMRTDAWKVLGYDSWPGSPRGLESYRAPLKSPPS
jgi:hypothetical protein